MVAQLGLGPVLGQEGRDDPDARGPGGQEAGPEAVGAVGGDGVVAEGEQGQVVGGGQDGGGGDAGVLERTRQVEVRGLQSPLEFVSAPGHVVRHVDEHHSLVLLPEQLHRLEHHDGEQYDHHSPGHPR